MSPVCRIAHGRIVAVHQTPACSLLSHPTIRQCQWSGLSRQWRLTTNTLRFKMLQGDNSGDTACAYLSPGGLCCSLGSNGALSTAPVRSFQRCTTKGSSECLISPRQDGVPDGSFSTRLISKFESISDLCITRPDPTDKHPWCPFTHREVNVVILVNSSGMPYPARLD